MLQLEGGGQQGGVTADGTKAWTNIRAFDNGRTYYLTIYYDDGLDEYKRIPIFTQPEMPTGLIAIPKGGSYKIGEPELSTFPGLPSDEHTGEPCWKIRIQIQGGARTYSQSSQSGYYMVRTLLPENEKYKARSWAAFTTYMEKNTFGDNCESAIRNGEVLIPPIS